MSSFLNEGIENKAEYVLSDFGMHENEEAAAPAELPPRHKWALAEDKGWVFSAVISQEETDALIVFLEREEGVHWRAQGRGDSASGKRNYRNYSRQCFFSAALGELLVSRMGGRLLPESMTAARVVRKEGREPVKPKRGDDGVMETGGVVGTEGEWEFSRVNPYFRALRYGAGDYFAPHTDGATSLNTAPGGAYEERSFITIMVYLNGGFEGGATQFFRDGTPLYERPAHDAVLVDSVAPASGQLLAFWHHAVHAGEAVVWPQQQQQQRQQRQQQQGEGESGGGTAAPAPVARGTHKIALRTEAMFVRRSVPVDPLDPEGGGMAMLREARGLSDAGRYPEAIHLFNRLRHQYPHLAEAEGVL